VLLYQYLRLCGDHRNDLGKQIYVLAHIDRVACTVKQQRRSRSILIETATMGLRAIIFPERFFLPIDPCVEVKRLVVERCRVMTSKKLPLFLVFARATPDATVVEGDASRDRDTYTVMYKNGDDLRQDQLTLQLLTVMDQLWKADGMDLKVTWHAPLLHGCLCAAVVAVAVNRAPCHDLLVSVSHIRPCTLSTRICLHRCLTSCPAPSCRCRRTSASRRATWLACSRSCWTR
jgi:phosphatidylinositol-4,5-bisphosphate 3-kinase